MTKKKNKSDLQKGDVEEARNYRPICTLLALVLQGRFRRSFQTLGILQLYKLLEQRCREWGI